MRAPEDRVVPWRRVAGVVGPCVGILVVFGLVAVQPGLVETIYVDGLGRILERGLGGLTGWVPFSLAEWIEAGVVAWLLLAPLHALYAVRQGRRSLRNVVAHGLARLIALVALVLVGFYATWGLHYARAPLNDRMGWAGLDPEHPTSTTIIVSLADELIELTNDQYRVVHGTDDAGEMTPSPPRSVLDDAVEEGWGRSVDSLGLTSSLARRRRPAKPLLSSPLFSVLGISGFYFPFTAEPNFNTWTPGWQLPLTIAHEKAHQRGFASEDEANFLGFLVCLHSPEPTVRYSGLLFAQRQLLFTLLRIDPWVAYALIERRLPGVQRDVSESRAFWDQFDGGARDMSRAVNDAYLKANRVQGGIDSYNRATELILAWAGSRGLDLSPPGVESR